MSQKKPSQYNRDELINYYNKVDNPAVPLDRFLQRVSQSGWTLERAATATAYRSGGTTHRYTEYYNALPPEERGVTFNTFYSRVMRGWDMHRAAREKPREKTAPYREYYDKHPNPQVDFAIFYVRVHSNNWEMERAITTPVVPIADGRDWCPERVFYENNRHRAKVDLSLFHNRVKMRKWDMETALTTPKRDSATRNESLHSYFDNHPNPQVSYKTFVSRAGRGGWTKESAITAQPRPVTARRNGAKSDLPLTPRQQRFAEAREFFKEHKDLAVVDIRTFLRRVCSDNWNPMQAITTELAETKTARTETGAMTNSLQSAFMNFCRPAVSSSTHS